MLNYVKKLKKYNFKTVCVHPYCVLFAKSLEIKASGGIKNYEQAKELIDNGATRLGASSGVLIVRGSKCNCKECNCSK